VVVEAARRSGSLITARFATEQGREVFAVPGSPLDPRSEGTNDLLREGATLCTRLDDVESALAPLLGRRRDDLFSEPASGPAIQEKFWDELDFLSADTSQNQPAPMLWRVEEEASPSPSPQTSNGSAQPSADAQAKLLVLLGAAPVNVDDLVRAMECSASEVRALLFELEVAGRLARYGGDLVALIPT